MDPILIAIGSAVAGVVVAFGYQNYASKKSPKKELAKEEKISDARAKEIILEAKDEAFRIKKEAEEEARKVRSETLSLEAKLAADEESLQRKLGELEKKESVFWSG